MTAIAAEKRVKFVGASEVATLMDCNQFEDRATLARRKAGMDPPKDLSAKPAVIWGHRLEDIILHYVNVDFPDYTASLKCVEHWPHKEIPGFAASPDCVGTCRTESSRGVIEAKSTGKNWWFPKDGSCPMQWQWQVQAQICCSDGYLVNGEPRFEWGALVCLAATSDYRLWHIPRNDDMIDTIKDEVHKFWEEVADLQREV